MVVEPLQAKPFFPSEPLSLEAAGLTESEVDGLVLKYLAARGDASDVAIASQIRLPPTLVLDCVERLKAARHITYRGAAGGNSLAYQITEGGLDRAGRLAAACTYFGAAPVSMDDYIESVLAQGITDSAPGPAQLRTAFDDLLLDVEVLERVGPAIASGSSIVLFGPSGNGKTSIATRISRSLGGAIWVPRALGADGQIVRVYDPHHHVRVPFDWSSPYNSPYPVDRRWVLIERPMVATGGELTLEMLEISTDPSTRISEAPLQVKANGGALVVDDLGRHRMRPADLLNRWLLPLETGYDYYSLNSGRRIQLPFQQVMVFSTNLEPHDLLDDAMLRRIPYKIPVLDPTESQFRELFARTAAELEVGVDPAALDRLIQHHYRVEGRPFRFCHPRDLLLQVRNDARYRSEPPRATVESLARAVDSYFSVI